MKSSMANLSVTGASIAAVLAISLAMALEEDDVTLLKRGQELFQPLPKDMATPESPIARERVDLGRMLFFDPRLTVDSNMSCASCHQPAFYGTDALSTSIGVKQRPHPRNAPTNLNSALNIIHWRGDRESVEDQVAKIHQHRLRDVPQRCGRGRWHVPEIRGGRRLLVATGSTNIDKGRFDVTKDPNDLYVFRVPSLRNVAMTAPYFHDGSVNTLPEAVKVMGRVQLGVTLSDADTGDIVAFLESLTGALPANFATAPTLPSGSIASKQP